MRLPSLALLLLPFPVLADTGLYPPGLLPLINRANLLLSTGQFTDAVRIYTEAIEHSPSDYLLYYKRATAHLSLARHAPALEDADRVLQLTAGSFDGAHHMKARIHAREGNFSAARASLDSYIRTRGGGGVGEDVRELERDIEEGRRMEEKMEKERAAELWQACVESASTALRTASHSIDIRSVRAECALASGDVDSAVGDLTRLASLLPPSTTLLMTISRLAYFFLPPSPAPMNHLKQCLHLDPDSKPCLGLYRLHKSFERAFAQIGDLEGKEDWTGIVKLLVGKGGKGAKGGEVLDKFDQALGEHTARDRVLPPQLAHRENVPEIPLPRGMKASYGRQVLVRALCRAYTQLGVHRERERWCEELLGMKGCEGDVEGLVGRAEGLARKEEWEEAVRTLEKALEASGGRRDIQQRLQRMQKSLKQSKQKDYYKILGVDRDADSRTIKKAFRRAAKTAHPDKGGSEAKMASVNEAYEVLNNPDLRRRFDNGEDPNDPMAAQGGAHGGDPFFAGQHPFAQFFQQAGGGGGGFAQGAGPGGFQFHFSTGR